jgi:uncharacterized membrane protein (UPF0127 family)
VVPQGFGTVTLVVTRPDGTTEEWCVWLADTPTLRSRGLMGVTATDLGGAPAMVFRFDDDTTAGFWMRSTLLPLSVAWYSSDGALVSSTDMAPCPVGETDCPVYDPAGAYRVAIEVPQGGLGAVGLVAGSMIELGREGCSVAAA